MRRVLFYIEPVVFRDDPRLLAPWVARCADLARMSAGAFSGCLATSRTLATGHETGFAALFAINPASLTAPFGFDRAAYAADLHAGDGWPNTALLEELGAIAARLRPDLVVSWTENRYLARAFGPGRVLFMEQGPLPREGLKLAAFLDPFGHQVGCAFARVAARVAPGFADWSDMWEQEWVMPRRQDASGRGIADWIAGRPAGRRTLLVALQPADWLTYEGAGMTLDPIALLQRVAWRTPPGWLVIPQWHPANHPAREEHLAALVSDQPNLMIPPPAMRVGQSELLLPYVDAVATVSSNIAAAAAIMGVPVRALGRSKFAGLDVGGTGVRPRGDLLAFLLGRYCRPLAEWTDQPGAFADALERRHRDPDALFRPGRATPSIIAEFQDATIA
jgi:hypothetical protein